MVVSPPKNYEDIKYEDDTKRDFDCCNDSAGTASIPTAG
jgi:hypothetical protein